MVERADLTTFTSGAARSVDVAAIERELVRVWKSAAETGEESAGGVTRACLLNLIVRAPGTAAEVAAAETVAVVSSELPCRALVLVEAGEAGGPPLEAWISAHCSPAGPGRRQVCCEQVTLRAAHGAVESLPSTVLALLVPDLPVALWWPGDPDFEGPLFGRLSRCVDRLCVDSAGFADAPRRLASLGAWRRAAGGREVCDLAWERLAPWRELVAGFFDAPPFQGMLPALDGVEIEAASAGGEAAGAAPAALFAGWMASRLRWTSGARGFESAGRPLHLALRMRAHDSGGLLRVVLRAARARTRFVVERDARQPSTLVARVESAGACPLPLRLAVRPLDGDRQLARVLARAHRNPAFESALEAGAAVFAAP